VDAYLRCPKEYQFAKVRGMSKMQTNIPDYFAIGSFMHAGRARWFAQKFDTGDATWQLMRDDITKVRCDFKLPCNDSAETTALRYLQEYVDHWGVREKPQIVAVEHMLGPTELWPGMDWTERTSRLDDFGFYPEAGGKLMIGELKTTAASHFRRGESVHLARAATPAAFAVGAGATGRGFTRPGWGYGAGHCSEGVWGQALQFLPSGGASG
jgi:hypothetical protein